MNVKLIILMLLISSQSFALTEAEGIRLLRKTYSYVDTSLLEVLKNKNKREAARYIIELEGSVYIPFWHDDYKEFSLNLLCLREKIPKSISCGKEKSFYEEASFKGLKKLYTQLDIAEVGNAKNKIKIDKDLTLESYKKLVDSDKSNGYLLRGIGTKALNKYFEKSYIDHILKSPNFFYENLVLFWSNHFVSTRQEVKDYALLSDQNNLIRKLMFSNFKDFVKAITINPAMIKYLNLDENKCISRKNKYDCSSINENYARELLELFTLGADPGSGEPICYTELDIETIAKALTGHTANKYSKEYNYRRGRSDYKFTEKKYPIKKAFLEKCDTGVLGVIPAVSATQITDTNSLIDVLFERRGKQIARHITQKLHSQFVTTEINWNDKEIKQAALQFSKDFNLKELMINLLSSQALYKDSSKNTIIKSPAELYFGTLKQLGLKDSKGLANKMKNAKQGLFSQPDVKGWRTGKGWIDTASFATRTLFVRRILGKNKKVLCEKVDVPQLKKYMLEGQQVTEHRLPKNIKTCAKKIGVLRRITSDPIYQVK